MARLLLLLLCACVGVYARCPTGCQCVNNMEVVRCIGNSRNGEGIGSIPSMVDPGRVRIL